MTTTHFKVGWLQRNGVAHSDRATMTEHFMRHGDLLTVVTIVDDPVYLEEPFIRSSNWVLNLTQEVGRSQFDVVDEVAGQPEGLRAALAAGVSRRAVEADRVRHEASAFRLKPRGAARRRPIPSTS